MFDFRGNNIKRFILKTAFCYGIVLVALLGLMVCTSGNVRAMSRSEFDTKIEQQKNKFPANMYWNHPNGANNPDGVSSTPCSHHHTGTCSYYGYCACNSYANAIQCMGFAFKMGADVFGSSPRSWSTSGFDWDSIGIGDVVSMDSSSRYHTVFVIDKNENAVTVAECNTDGHCIIKYGGTYSRSYIQSVFGNGIIYHNNQVDGTPSDTEAPTITRCWSEFDPANNYIAVHASATDNVGVDHVSFAIWTDGHDTKWVEVPVVNGTAETWFNFPYEADGPWHVHAYAYDSAGNASTCVASPDHYIDYYSTPPTISNVQITDVDATGYTITCNVTDVNGVRTVYFPTWSQNNGQDDLGEWPVGTQNGDTWSYRVKDSEHHYDKGNYITHIYADDNRNNRTTSTEVIGTIENKNTVVASADLGESHYALIDDAVSWDEAQKRCEEMGGHLVTIESAEENKTVASLVKKGRRVDYWIGLTDEEKEGTFKWVTGESLGSYHPWKSGEPNDYKGHEDYCNISQDDGAWNDNYNANIMGFVCEMSKKGPEISDVQVTNLDESGYTVTCKVTSDIGINRVQMPSWTEYNGQDDLSGIWSTHYDHYAASVSGDTYTYRVNAAEHNNEIGQYHTHIYVFDNAGRMTTHELNDIQVAAYNKTAKSETYEGNQYLRIDASCSWAEAKARCNALGGHLVTVTSQSEQDVVTRLVGDGPCRAYWMGLTDEKQDRSFAWITGESYQYGSDFYVYRNWTEGQPSYTVGDKNEDYVEIWRDGTWNDATGDCKWGFICEIEGGQEPTQSTIYNNHIYQLVEETMSWTEAKAKCEAMGGHLASITSKEENEALLALKNKGYSDSYWIGLTDEASTGNYTWTTGEATSYINWNQGEPNNPGVEHYVEIIPGGKWNNQTGGTTRGFICEMDYQKPLISNAQIISKDSSGYTVSCTVTGTNIDRVQFPSWTEADGQDDLSGNWETNTAYRGVKSGNTYTFRVNTTDHNDATGVYCTHIYAYDSNGGSFGVGNISASIINEASIKATETLNGNKYYLFEDGVTWTEARNQCQAIGGHLATITSQEEQDVVARLKQKGARTSYWIGLSGTKDTGFTWVNNEQFNFTAWDTDQPDNFGNRENKVSVWGAGKWNDADENTKYGYICEVDETVIPSAAVAYNGHDYELYEEQMNWAEAKAKCEAMGGHLVTIGSTEEANAVTGLLQKGLHSWYWIGAKRTEDNRFAWTNGDPWSYEYYMENQPDNHEGNQDVLRTNKNGTWDDVESTTLYGFICEKDSSDIQISNVKVSNITGAGYTVTCTVESSTPINRVQFPTWTPNTDGQDDLLVGWETNTKASGTKVGNTYTFRVNDSEHKGENGAYRTHIYAYDVAGNVKKAIVDDVEIQSIGTAAATENYEEHQYLLIDDKVTWDEARQKCIELGGHLVTITTKSEQNFVKELIQKGERGSYWIGLTDSINEGQFKWITDERYSYRNWGFGEPNNDSDNEDYAEISKDGKWNDNSSTRKTGYICEIEPTKAATATRIAAGKKYQIVDGDYSWEEAKAIAESMGGHLATITSHDEQEIIENLVKQGYSSSYYIGALGSTSASGVQTFKWITDEPWSYNDSWAEGQPDNHEGKQDYIRVNGKSGSWDDINKEIKTGFICEIESTLKVKSFTSDKASGQDAGTAISLKAEGTGGVSPYTYKISYTLGASEGVIKDFSSDNTATWKPAVAGNYTLKVEVKDGSGRIAKKEMPFAIKEAIQLVTGVSLNKTTTSLKVDGTETLSATVAPSNASNKAVSWSSNKTSVATVKDGIITAVAPGEATITVTTADGSKTATCKVTVTQPVTGVSLNKATTSLKVGGTETLSATVAPSNASNKAVSWSSNKTSVATVKDGIITAVAPGEATITVTTADGSKTATCKVTVTQPVTGVSLNKATTSLKVGATETLSATVAPSNASNKAVSWSSNKTSVATVKDGVITAVAPGEATITVTTADGSKTATCKVTVTQPVTGVSLNKATTSLKVGGTETLSATVAPSNASNKAVSWSSNKTSVATVNNGVVTAVAPGEATITVTTADGSKTATCKVTVTQPVTGVSLNKATTSLKVGATETLSATIAPSNASNKAISWSSNKTSVATVNNGVVTAVAPGEATITVTTADGSKTATCKVTVAAIDIPVESITLNKTKVVLDVGGNETLKATITPTNATNQAITWASNNNTAATVSTSGEIKALAPGEATITATTANGKQASCTVTVNAVAPVDQLGISGSTTPSVVHPGEIVTVTINLDNYDISDTQIGTVQVEIPNQTAELNYVADSRTSIIADGEFSSNPDNIIFTYFPIREGDNILPKDTKGLFTFQMQVSDQITEDMDIQLPMLISIGDENDKGIMEEAEANIIVQVRKKIIMKGDLDGNGNIAIMDARKAKRAATKTVELTEDEFEAADLNNDGKVTIMEARKIKRVAMKEATMDE